MSNLCISCFRLLIFVCVFLIVWFNVLSSIQTSSGDLIQKTLTEFHKRGLSDKLIDAVPGEKGPGDQYLKGFVLMGKAQDWKNVNFVDVDQDDAKPKIEAIKLRQPGAEVQHIAFLKVHKAASSTAQNIFLRFGWKRNLTFVLAPADNPSRYPNIISLRESLTETNILPPPAGKHYDILCNHVFYEKEAFSRFMPSDAQYIGIVREPFELYKSILNYFRPRYIFKLIEGPNPASQFLRDPEKYEPKGKLFYSWTNNRMAIEFGFPESLVRSFNQTAVDSYLEKLGSEFAFVIVSEYFEDSVVMMRRILNWQTKDILYLSLNVAKKKNETAISQPYDRTFYKNYAKLDYAIYDFFYHRLRDQIRHEGSDYDDELLAFKDIRKSVQEFCTTSYPDKPAMLDFPETRWGHKFTIDANDCRDLMRPEIPFITDIRVRQYGSKDI